MYTVYVLQDEQGRRYKGMTADLTRRLKEHRAGRTHATRHMERIKVIYIEEYATLEAARARELYFKSAAGRKFLKQKTQNNNGPVA